ncbi:MAG: PQQ-binding-like beta-propeller repeat protein [Verrucomicrobiales bacterium]
MKTAIAPLISIASFISLLFVLLSLLTTITSADEAGGGSNWAQWRGPLATGGVESGNPVTEWSETKNVKWKVKLEGSGTATPIVWGDKIFIAAAINTKEKPGVPGGAKPDAGNAQTSSDPSSNPAENVYLVQAEQPQGEPGGAGGRPLDERMRRYDTDKDGKLDEKEMATMREAMRNRRGAGGGGRRGGGGRGAQKPSEIHRFTLSCLDRNTGKVIWTSVACEELPHEGHHRDHGFASASPATDGEHIYVSFGSRGIFCFDMEGKKKWEKDLGDMRTRNSFGEGTSPALYGDTLVIKWDHEGDSFIAALDKKTGDEIWRRKRDEQTTWSTPFVVESGGKPVTIATGSGMVAAYDLKTGDIVWQTEGLTGNPIPSPVTDGELVYVMSGFRGSKALAIELGKTGILSSDNGIAWSYDEGTPYVPSPLLYRGRLYFFQTNNAILTCLDAKTGDALYSRERIDGIRGVYASPLGAGGNVYLLGREGGCVVIKAGDDLEPIATNQLDEKFDASPVLVGDDLFLRGHEYLYCISASKG